MLSFKKVRSSKSQTADAYYQPIRTRQAPKLASEALQTQPIVVVRCKLASPSAMYKNKTKASLILRAPLTVEHLLQSPERRLVSHDF